MSEAIKTLKIKILSPNKGKKEALGSTVEIHNSVIAQYIDLTLQHRFLLNAVVHRSLPLEVRKESVNKKTGEVCLRPHSNSEILTELEKLSLPTPAHPNTQINIKSLFPGLPTNWRRSCINTSTGMCKSYLSNLKNWESHRKGKPPKPPTARNLPTFYYSTYQLQIFPGEESPVLSLTGVSKNADDNRSITNHQDVGLSPTITTTTAFKRPIEARSLPQSNPQIELFDIKNQFVRLKVYDGEKWVWKNYPVSLGSKQFLQLNNPNWSRRSPTLVPKRTKRGIEWYLHIPLAKKVDVKPIKEQKKENPNLTTLAVDLGLRHLAVVTVRQGGKIVFVKFFRGEEVEAHRLKHLQKVFRKQQASGKPVRGERSNKQLWRHIKATNLSIAHNLTKEIVDIALHYSVKLIVIEHLHKFQPKRGVKRSKKLNRKLTYWLKGQISEQLRYKAFAEGILVKSVNPAFTSRICNKCGGFGERFSHKSLFRCHFCGYCVNADFNASLNLHKVFWEIFPFPRKKKLKPKVACL